MEIMGTDHEKKKFYLHVYQMFVNYCYNNNNIFYLSRVTYLDNV